MRGYYTEEEYIYVTHDHEVRNQIEELRIMTDKLTEAIRSMIDSYMDLVEEGRALGLNEDEIIEDYRGWPEEFEDLKNFIEDKELNI